MFRRIETARLILRKPERADAVAIFPRYASVPYVRRLVGWPRNASIDATRAFLDHSEGNGRWAQWPAGPFAIESRERTGVCSAARGWGLNRPIAP